VLILSITLKRIFVSRKPQLTSPKGLRYRRQALEYFIAIFLSVAAFGVLALTLGNYPLTTGKNCGIIPVNGG
jgi:hypothetical protein